MQNSTSSINTEDPKYKAINQLAYKCFNENATHSSIVPGKYKEDKSCYRTFDGFACWDQTPAGATAFQSCPRMVLGFDPKLFAFKECLDNGTWFKHPESMKTWTNYTTCVDVKDLEFRKAVNNIYVTGYSVSVAAILLSLAIFVFFRTLHCTRIKVHMHLFASFALSNVLWLAWYKNVVNTVVVVLLNKMWCQALHLVTHYFMLASYMWMFCEGLHLHLALVVVFVKDHVAMRWFIAVGWGLSLVITVIYAVVRYHVGTTERCWMDQDDTIWILIAPVAISQFLSFVFLINVIRVLLTKLHPAPNNHDMVAAKKAARAAIILIPLFGLHFILIPLRPAKDAPGEKFYQVVAALLTSLQGLWVSLLYCFTNHDVTTAARQYMSRYQRSNEAIPMTGVTGGESVINTRDNVV